MNIVYHKFFSEYLGQDFEFKSYGTAGKPVMVFPTSGGRFYDYEDRGMIAAAAEFIEREEVRMFAVDGRDRESWQRPEKDGRMGERHALYEACITEEFIPFARKFCGVEEKFIAAGNSFGAFHAANFFLKFPGSFDAAVCLSGLYSLRTELHGYCDDAVFFNEPLSYLPGLKDEGILARLKTGYMVIAHGRGAWEQFNDQARELADIARGKGIAVWYDAWDETWPHDWCTWHAQIRKYLACFSEGVMANGGRLKLTGPGRRMNALRLGGAAR